MCLVACEGLATEENGVIGSTEGNNWLPDRNPYRTNSPKSVWEITPYYTSAYSRGCLFVRGEKPRELAHISKISSRKWQQYQNDLGRENPILTGLRFLRVFEQESVRSYAQAAEILDVSRQRVYQLVSLVTKLPDQIKNCLISNEDPVVGRYFTERRLRPLTALGTAEEKVARFDRMLEVARKEADGHAPI